MTLLPFAGFFRPSFPESRRGIPDARHLPAIAGIDAGAARGAPP